MSAVGIISSVVAILAVTIIAWFYSLQRRQHKLQDAHRERIQEALASISREATRKREHPDAPPAIDVSKIFARLHALLEDQLSEVVAEARQIERLWVELNALQTDNQADVFRAGELVERIKTLATDILQEMD